MRFHRARTRGNSPGWRAVYRAATRPAGTCSPQHSRQVAARQRHSRGSRAAAGPCATGRHWRAGWRSCGGSPAVRAPSVHCSIAPLRQTVHRAGNCAASFPGTAIVRHPRAPSPEVPDVLASCLQSRGHRRFSGRSSLSGCAVRSSASADVGARTLSSLARPPEYGVFPSRSAAAPLPSPGASARGRRPLQTAGTSHIRGTALRVPRAIFAREPWDY